MISPTIQMRMYLAIIELFLFIGMTVGNDDLSDESTAGCTVCKSSLQFANPAAKKYEVGNDIPYLPFKMKTSYAGLMPIDDQPTVKNASLYFWMFGKDGPTPGDDLVIWLNGGPGCASISAAITESGPFFIQVYGEGPTRPNPYSFTRAATIVYLNYPFGVTFTTGVGNNTNQEQISQQFISFLEHFYDIFAELSSKNLWIVGESVGGKYIGYIFDAMRKRKGTLKQPKGGMMIDPLISERIVQTDLVIYPFSVQHQQGLNLSNFDLEQIKEEAQPCGMDTYVQNYLRFPPKGRLPNFNHSCSPFDLMQDIEYNKTDTFNEYNYKRPDLSNYAPDGFISRNEFYSDPNVQSYIHAPVGKNYTQCSTVFPVPTDHSLPVDRQPNFQHSLLAQAIEESQKFTIIHGELDALFPTTGLELALQNLTWADQQGFTTAPHLPVYNMDNLLGGVYTYERGLMYARIFRGGHKLPRDDGSTALAALKDLLGQKDWSKREHT